MSKFNIYIIKEIIFTLAFLVILLTGILWLGQGLRHVELLTTDNISFSSYISYIFLLIPKIMTLTIPISVFLSVIFILNRVRSDSELIILWASGESNSNIILKPIMLIAIIIFAVMLLITTFITPYALNEIRFKIIDIRSSGLSSSILEEKKFISPSESLTIFIQERDGIKINNLLIHDNTNQEKPQTYIAQNGEFISNDQKKILRLYNGSTQIFNKSEQTISEIDFETYDLDLNPYSRSESTHRYPDELLTKEIIHNISDKSFKNFNGYEKEQFAELNNRFISPIYLFCYALLPILILKTSRNPNESWVLPISIVSLLALSIKVIEVSLSNILVDKNELVYLTYFIPILFIIVFLIMIYLDKSINPFNKNALKT